MKSTNILLILLSSLLLSACLQTSEDRKATWENRCKSFGHKAGSAELATCIGEEYRAYRQRADKRYFINKSD